MLSVVTAAEVVEAPVLEPAGAYEARRILPRKFAADMRHIAVATIADVHALVSWNFRHVVKLEKIRLFNVVNVERGYGPCRSCPRGRWPAMKDPKTRAVAVVREIRDRHAKRLAGKSPADIIAFYRRTGEAALEDAQQRKSARRRKTG